MALNETSAGKTGRKIYDVRDARDAFASAHSAAESSKQGLRSVPETRSVEGETRSQVLRYLLKHGPSTAGDLGEFLGFSAAGVRRHLENLVKSGLAEVIEWRDGKAVGRGRPSKYYRLTDEGRAQFGHAYDELGSEALAALREIGGDEAVDSFARRRVDAIVEGIEPAESNAESVERTMQALAEAFEAHGYAVTVDQAGLGLQLCQHHCPVANVASDHPELCEAEHEVISALVGIHVQPLATITDGHGICTTNIPLGSVIPAATEVQPPLSNANNASSTL